MMTMTNPVRVTESMHFVDYTRGWLPQGYPLRAVGNDYSEWLVVGWQDSWPVCVRDREPGDAHPLKLDPRAILRYEIPRDDAPVR
jgi:hypothetical protein